MKSKNILHSPPHHKQLSLTELSTLCAPSMPHHTFPLSLLRWTPRVLFINLTNLCVTYAHLLVLLNVLRQRKEIRLMLINILMGGIGKSYFFILGTLRG